MTEGATVTPAPREALRAALSGRRAWLVGGAVRDRLLERPTPDLDIVVEGDPRAPARALAAATGASAFALSEAFGAWRVVASGQLWQVDLTPLRGGSLAADLALRDFTINALAEPLAGGALIDPTGGEADLRAGRLRMASARAYADDPLRVLRLVRLASELELEPEPATLSAARAHAAGLSEVAAERIWLELRRIVASARPVDGVELMAAVGATAVILPELEALRGMGQTRYHHLDVHDHTLAVLEEVVALEAGGDGARAALGPRATDAAAVLAEPLAEGLTRGTVLRLGALLHDAAKPATRIQLAGGRVGFPGHDRVGSDLARDVLGRLRAGSRVAEHVSALTRHHLRLGFLVHQRPLSRRAVHAYLSACQPVGVDVTVLSVADRLATRGRKAQPAIAAHLELARDLLPEALAWRAAPPGPPLVRGDELAHELGLPPGPALGELLAELAAAAWAGEIDTPKQAIAHARRLLGELGPAGSARG